MAKIDPAQLWSTQYRLVSTVITDVAPAIAELGLEVKALFVLAEVDAHPHPAELAARLCMPKPTVTVHLKHLEAADLVRREIDRGDLRRHRLSLTPKGRQVMQRGLALLSAAFGARLAGLSAREQAALAALLAKLG